MPDAPLIIDADELPERPAWDVVTLARHARRPTGREYIALLADSFLELHGDRQSADSSSIVGGFAELGGGPVMVVATQKGHSTRELVETNFGMAGPEGYRKALRLFRLAEKLGLPVVTLVDTPGAHPGVEAEQHGQSAAIAANILALTGLNVPVVAVITGEGGSGGALALAWTDTLLIQTHAVFSVIGPEGAAVILERDATRAPDVAGELGLTSARLLDLGIVDGVIPDDLDESVSAISRALDEVSVRRRRRRPDLASAAALSAPPD